MSEDLLVTKLYIPPARKNLVSRVRLVQLLDDAWQQDKNLYLVSASAGYGKTTLIAEWLRSLEAKSTWLSLDEADNDPARFLAYLIAALKQVESRVGENTRAMLRSPQPLPPEVVLTTLINEIASIATPFVLVLDDYQVIETLPIHQQIGFLVEHQPPQMRLIMITREDPPLPLARLRARGQMLEIRQDVLRFSLDECTEFLQRVMHLQLSGDDIEALERRTEGWIAGLQLAALSMQGREDLSGFVHAFTGSSHYVLEYLIEEVFERQSTEEQDFLLKTSILDRLSGPLCDAVSGRAGSQLLLDRLEHANLFIVPLDQSRRWYRYHRLFADLLRQRLRSTESLSENNLHKLASQWFASEGLFSEAIHHALAASDWEGSADLISNNSETMLRRGELATMLTWLKALPDEGICNRPQLCRDYGWALSLTGQFDAADAYLKRAEAAVQGNEALLGTILVALAFNQRSRGDNQKAIESARRALSLLSQGDSLSRSLVALTLGLAYLQTGNLREAEQTFLEVDQPAQQSRNHYARMTALTYLGIIQGIYGRLHRAAELCRQVIQIGGGSPPVALAHIELGALFYEWNDLDAAAHHLQIGIELSQRTGNVPILSDGYRTLALLQQASGESESAVATLQKAHQLAYHYEVSPLTRSRNAACHVQLALGQGDLANAQYWADQSTEDADSSLFYPQLGLTPVRLCFARKDKDQAAERLKVLYEAAHRAGWEYGVVEVCALQALAAADPHEARQFLETAMIKSRAEGFIRIFVDKGEPMKALLERLRAQGGELKAYLLSILAVFGEMGSRSIRQPLIEPLSARELEVLHFLEQGMSNSEIAARLVVSVGTIKTHVHSILDKLDVRSRTQAVSKARELGLL